MESIRRGEVWWVSFEPAVGGEIRKTRPAVIVSNNAANAVLNRVVVVLVTSKTCRLMERTRTDRDQFKPDRYFIASDAIGFVTHPIHFWAPACRFVSTAHRFGLRPFGLPP